MSKVVGKKLATQPKVAEKPQVKEVKVVKDDFTLKQYKKFFGPKSNYSIDLTSKDVDTKLRTRPSRYTKEQVALMKIYRKKLADARKKKAEKKGGKKPKKVVAEDKKKKIVSAIKAYRKKMEERKKKRSSIRGQLIEKISKKYEDKLRTQEARRRQKKAEKRAGTAGTTGKKVKKSKKKGEKMDVDMLPVDPEKQQKFETKLKKKVSRLALRRYQKIVGIKRPTQGRLFVYAIFTGYRRGQRRQHPNWALLRIEGVENQHDAKFYVGKACAYVYKPTKRHGKKQREESKDSDSNKPSKTSFTKYNLGRIRAVHGKSGAVRAVFKKNLPPSAMGHRVRVFLYPSNI